MTKTTTRTLTVFSVSLNNFSSSFGGCFEQKQRRASATESDGENERKIDRRFPRVFPLPGDVARARNRGSDIHVLRRRKVLAIRECMEESKRSERETVSTVHRIRDATSGRWTAGKGGGKGKRERRDDDDERGENERGVTTVRAEAENVSDVERRGGGGSGAR